MQDLLGSLGPDERFRVLVPCAGPVPDVGFEGPGAGAGAAADELVGQEPEPPFYLTGPRRSGRGEVHAEAGVAVQPCLDLGGLAGGVVVADQVNARAPPGPPCRFLMRNFLNSAARWRRCRELMTVPSSMLNAANRLVMPCR